MNNISLGLFLKNARISKGYSLCYLSNISGITFRHISLIENDKCKPTLSTLKSLCSALDLNFNTVVEQFYCIKDDDSNAESITLGTFIKNARILKGLTLQQLSDLAGISSSQICFIERDKYKPQISTLMDLCSALNLDYKTVVKRFYCIKESDSDMEVLSLGAFLKNARLLRGFTNQQLADLTGISPSYIRYIENDSATPSLSLLRGICFALEVDFDELSKKYF